MRTEKKTTKDAIDKETGEIISTVQTITISKARGDKAFIKIFKACTDTVLEDLKINDGRLRLLFWFIKQIQDTITINADHIVLAHVSRLAADLNTSEVSVRRWIQVLIDRGYISRHTINGHTIYNNYQVNKEYIYKGVLSKLK